MGGMHVASAAPSKTPVTATATAEFQSRILEDSLTMYREQVIISADEHYLIEWNRLTDVVSVTNQNEYTRTGTMEEIRQIQNEMARLAGEVEEIPEEIRIAYPGLPLELEDDTMYPSGNTRDALGTADGVELQAANMLAGSFGGTPNTGSVTHAGEVLHYLQGVNGCQVATGAAGIAHAALWGAALGGPAGLAAGAAIGAFWWGVGTQC